MPSLEGKDRQLFGNAVANVQMRYDFLYRYWNKYATGGFKRLVREGYSCENTYYNYVPSI
jgi:hypothetical protein